MKTEVLALKEEALKQKLERLDVEYAENDKRQIANCRDGWSE